MSGFIKHLISIFIFYFLCKGGINGQTKTYLNPNVGIGIVSPINPNARLHIKEPTNGLSTLYLEGANLFAIRFKSIGQADVNTTTHRISQVYNFDDIDRNGIIDFVRGGNNSGGGLGLGSNGIERMRIAGNGSIGIGTINPRASFDVGSTSINTLTTVLGRLAEGDGNGEGTFLGVRAINTQPWTTNSFSIEHKFNNVLNSAINFYRGGGWDGGYLTFATNNGTERMRIDQNGRVGIGTNTPATKLHIGNGGDGFENGLTIHSTYPTIYFRDSDNPQKSAMIHLNGSNLHFLSAPYALPNSGNNWTQVNPGYWPMTLNLENNGAVFGGDIAAAGSFFSSGSTIKVGKLTSTDTEEGLTTLQLNARGAGGTTKHWSIYTAPVGGGWGVNPNAFEIWQYPETLPRFKILVNGNTVLVPNGGNVGIGVNNPSEKLSVNGNIVAKKVRVTQTGWPDYVFHANYPLLPLPDLQAFIQKNKHLPEVPSEKQVSEKGLDLGEMNAVLLKKIEELTLYIIDLQKQINELKGNTPTRDK